MRLPPIVLASGSPRRRDLLAQLGVVFTIVVPDVDESPLAGEDPLDYVGRLAFDKLQAVAAEDGTLVIAADTTVELDGSILGKPNDIEDARAMLRRLSGRTHRVHTGVALRRDEGQATQTITSLVTFIALADATIEWYLGTGEPIDKAGAYAIQGAGAALVERVQGSVSNIVGLPLHTVVALAADLGVRLLN